MAAPALATGQPTPTRDTCPSSNGLSVEQSGATTGRSRLRELAQAYAFDPLYSSNDYGAGSTVALVEMAGAGYSSSDINAFASCYGITLGDRADLADEHRRQGAPPGAARSRRSSTSRRRSPWRRKANIEVYEGGTSDSLYTSSARSSATTPPRSSAPAGPTGARPTSASPSRTRRTHSSRLPPRRGSRSSSPRGTRARRDATSTERSMRSLAPNPVAQAVDSSTGTLYIANKSSNTLSVDSEGSTSVLRTSPPSVSVHHRLGPRRRSAR